MEEEYDVVVCGTGLKECILSGLLSCKGMKVLHLERNGYYGGESASLNLTNLWEKFRPGQTPPASLGSNRDWNVDLVPKFVMACGKLVKVLLYTKVTRYLQWKSVEGSYVYQISQGGMFSQGGKAAIHKVPATDVEAVKSSLMGFWEKKRCRKFLMFVQGYEANDPSTHQGMDLNRMSTREFFAKFQLEENTIDFIGHALALYPDEAYLDQPAAPAVEKIQLYSYSLQRYGKSPFIYPLYGLGGLPEGFSRLSAIHGGTYMLNKPVDEIVFDEHGHATGVRSGSEVARCKMVICDPSYVTGLNKTRSTGKVVRCICIASHPIPSTHEATSCQIIIPQKQVNRRSDIYIAVVSWAHCVAGQNKYIVIISTTVETANPEAELEPAFELLGAVDEKFFSVSDTYEPISDGTHDKLFVSKSFDASSHFESATDDCLEMYKRITGEELDLTIRADPEDLEGDS
eukprot:GILJ01000378.1.p1 GENE.GILJ01000378.1~~GILJ01000378.1.p1  ORF type:complete len:473 (-),score=80.50 GILJ01000378.1:148-1521(-)